MKRGLVVYLSAALLVLAAVVIWRRYHKGVDVHNSTKAVSSAAKLSTQAKKDVSDVRESKDYSDHDVEGSAVNSGSDDLDDHSINHNLSAAETIEADDIHLDFDDADAQYISEDDDLQQ